MGLFRKRSINKVNWKVDVSFPTPGNYFLQLRGAAYPQRLIYKLLQGMSIILDLTGDLSPFALSVGTQSSIKSECNRRWTRRTCLELSSQIFPRPSAKFKWTLVIYFIEFGSVLDARMDSP
ncbi:hypothetical protein AVEN_222658-1 [Araneus ventricosus]|uniref:Uncharacterized protein n=1 Tax=Araneus ventricosus TaxID=182803 RepID=A0A4Y2PSP8_ARAVE|nr:hypothetical protein AVEN_222658-1 [Araneus ventricosus]